MLESLTGPFAEGGKENLDGFNLYLDSINGTVAGRKIQTVVADDQGKPDVGLTKAKQLVENDKVQMLMGITPTPVCYAVAKYVAEAHVPLAASANCGANGVTTDPQFKSPYLLRVSVPGSEFSETMADWASKQYHKAAIISSDFGGGLEISDAFASAFVKRGGTIVQEAHPALGTTDFGPFLAQLSSAADVVMFFGPGVDAKRFGEQYGSYSRKLPVLDLDAQISKGPNLVELKDKALGMVASNIYSEGIDTPANKAFIAALHQKYPGRPVSAELAQGYASAQILEAAIKKVNGSVENKDQFLNALYSTDLMTVKGQVKLDQYHDIIQSIYIYQIVKSGDGYGEKVLATYNDVSQFWDRTQGQLARLPYGKLKGKWVGMTKEQLAQLYGS